MLKTLNKYGNIKNKALRWTVIGTILLVFISIVAMVSVLTVSYFLGPPPLKNDQNTIYYSQSGKVIGEEHGMENRYWTDLEDISPSLIQATLTTEDRDFYQHFGFDFTRILSAAFQDLTSMSMVQGASTITQQYARNLYLSQEKTWTRKFKEAIYTIRLEMFYDKDTILEGYLNTIYYGHGSYGIEAASRYFFNKSANALTLAESALLAGIPKGPSYYSPFRDYENAKERQAQILAAMEERGQITEQDKYLATREKLALSKQKERKKIAVAPYFQDVVLEELKNILDEDIETIRSGGYQVYTTLNRDKQRILEQQIQKKMKSSATMQVGALAMNPKTGGILSLVGGRNYEKSQFNRVVQAKRMPGSSFKPFLYYAALTSGYTPTTTLMSKPTNFKLANGQVYQPSNYNGYYAYEPITLAQALALSDNIYAVKTNLYLSPDRLVKTAKKFGIDSKLQPVPSLALGTSSVSVEEMVTGYSRIANGGIPVDAYTIEKITDIKGNVIYEKELPEKDPVLDPKQTFILSQLMTGMFDESLNGYMRVTGASIADQLTRTYAGKSGTTDTDSWMIGFSPDIVTGVWTGYDQNKPIEKTQEKQYAKEIWAGFMEEAHEGIPTKQFKKPDGVISVLIDPKTGDLATRNCEPQRLMYFVEGTQPTSYCTEQKPKEQDKSKEENAPNKSKKKKGFWELLKDMLS
ncbi:PBP1A family penicillin-binding protein [Aquibacillus sp. 3ASR75-11]|uniref:PBP1A family penicillin-binding protein n=1 Tax=Terrihalobacillus insolitus TaxID=2950438 RepID=A0A9X4AM65_9BACI|nr:PBP1A family penicillin-binding protein [Terrihalobacillus insolitus]MDC3414964.1 PBP1A family penicillin-binding protein [Terrihalobacillus insolitus]MDC3425077.1 PBP1A family penicillin-binding protein [Terrihalobacillus insolitus]